MNQTPETPELPALPIKQGLLPPEPEAQNTVLETQVDENQEFVTSDPLAENPEQDTNASTPPPPAKPSHLAASPTLIIGIAITLLGVIFFLSEAGIPYIGKLSNFWPLTLVAIGYVKLKNNQERSNTGAWLLIGLGTLLLLDQIPGFELDDLLGPMILTGIGVAIILHSIKRQQKKRPEYQKTEDCVSGQALFSSLKHRHPRSAFKGGDITSIFGSAEIDLRDAFIEGESATLECFVMFGGAEIRVPETWDVRVQASAIFGGIENKSTPAPSDATNRPVLLLSGLVLFGGVEVRS